MMNTEGFTTFLKSQLRLSIRTTASHTRTFFWRVLFAFQRIFDQSIQGVVFDFFITCFELSPLQLFFELLDNNIWSVYYVHFLWVEYYLCFWLHGLILDFCELDFQPALLGFCSGHSLQILFLGEDVFRYQNLLSLCTVWCTTSWADGWSSAHTGCFLQLSIQLCVFWSNLQIFDAFLLRRQSNLASFRFHRASLPFLFCSKSKQKRRKFVSV